MATKKKPKIVIVRTRDAGVHIGELASRSGIECELINARRLWRWRGANTLNEISQSGVDKTYSRISQPVARITVIGACEILECSDEAAANLTESRWPA